MLMPSIQSSRRKTLIIGVYLLFSCLPSSHTTVHAVPHTAVPILGAIRDMNPSALDSLLGTVSVMKPQGALSVSH